MEKNRLEKQLNSITTGSQVYADIDMISSNLELILERPVNTAINI